MRSPASRSRFGHRDADSAGQEHAGSHRSGSGGGTSASGTAGGQGLSGCTRAGSGLWPEETLAESAAAAAAAATAAMAGAKSKAAAAAASAAFQRVPVTAAASKVVPARVASAGVAAPDGTRWSDIVDDDEEQIELDYVGL